MGLFDESGSDGEDSTWDIEPHVVDVNADMLSQRLKPQVEKCQELGCKVVFYVTKGGVGLGVS
jgi:hypothetical protein